MAFAIYDTATLLAVVNEKMQEMPSTYFLGRYFPSTSQFDTETINFDVVSEAEILAPFVSPVVQGRVMKNQGYTTKTFAPAYVKPKHIVEPNKAFKRKAGEAIGGMMSAGDRYLNAIAENIALEMRMIQRRFEAMAAESLIYGTVTVSGEDYPTTVVDFGRDAGQTIALGTGARWGDAGVSIVQSIEDMVQQTFELSGYAPTEIHVGAAVWKMMAKDVEVKELLDIRRGADDVNLQLGITSRNRDGQYKGTLGVLDVYVYSGGYTNDAGTAVKHLPTKDILLASSGVEGVRCFGAILDAEAGLAPLEMFPKMWINQDPSVTYTMIQSAPLMVPVRPNATLRATVIA